MLEDRRSRSSRKTPDLVTDELILILHEAGMLEFNDIFQRTVVVMKAKHMSLGGEEILRLRIYEKLQNLVSAGGLMKKAVNTRPCPADFFEIGNIPGYPIVILRKKGRMNRILLHIVYPARET